MTRNWTKNPYYWIAPILLMLILTPWSAQIDLAVSRYFYHDGHFLSSQLFNFVYDYGILPGWITILIALNFLIGSLFLPQLKKWRRPCSYLILTLAIGSGIIVHAVFKDHWGRPRPRQSIEFGGDQPFRAFYQPHFNLDTEPSKSFPCGHCSMGFYFFTLVLLGSHYRNRKLFYTGIGLTILLGVALSVIRIAQGGHFVSDVLFSALIMWLTALWLYNWMFPEDSMSGSDSTQKREATMCGSD